MTDEENKAMKLLNDMIKHKPDTIRLEWRKGIYALQLILNLIEKQTKQIEELKKYEEGYKLLSYSLDNYISKDKIKAKIEELEEDLKEYENGQEWEIQDEIRGQIDVLQSLLEKE